jgi:hypothetical protein
MKKKKKKNPEEELRLVETLDDVEVVVYKDLIKKDDCEYTVNKDETTCTLHKLLKVYETLYIPEKIGEYTVTKLENKLSEAIFENTDKVEVKKVILPNTIKVIGKHCFNECRSVETFVLNEGVELIDVASFSYCEGMTDIILPKSVQRVEDYAFRNCSKLERITFQNGATLISKDPFVITSGKSKNGEFKGCIYSLEDSKVEEYAEDFNKKFEIYDYIKMDVAYHGSRPTSNDHDFISRDNIEVLATWSNTVVDTIKDYKLDITTSGHEMDLGISFYKFEDHIKLDTSPKKIEKLEVAYHGPAKHKIKLSLNKDDFTVVAYYNDWTHCETKNFSFDSDYLKTKGVNLVTIKFDGIEAPCQVVGKKGFLWF